MKYYKIIVHKIIFPMKLAAASNYKNKLFQTGLGTVFVVSDKTTNSFRYLNIFDLKYIERFIVRQKHYLKT